VVTHKIRWVVQCKCYDRDVTVNNINDVNIPTLIHRHKANGYLLVCKKGIHNGIVEYFQDLNKQCKMNYNYIHWCGEDFLRKLVLLDWRRPYFNLYFNKYHLFMKKQEVIMKNFNKANN